MALDFTPLDIAHRTLHNKKFPSHNMYPQLGLCDYESPEMRYCVNLTHCHKVRSLHKKMASLLFEIELSPYSFLGSIKTSTLVNRLSTFK